MSTTIKFDKISMPGAYFAGENPMPSIWDEGDIHGRVEIDDTIPESERGYFGYGQIETMLPYCLTGSNRDIEERSGPHGANR